MGCSQAATALAMDGMNLGGRQIKVSMAKASSVAKMGDNRGRGRDNSIPPPRQLQVHPAAPCWCKALHHWGSHSGNTLARNKRHTGDAPSNQPIMAGVFPQRNVGTLK